MKLRYITISTALLAIMLLFACVKERPEGMNADMEQQIALLPESANAMGYINIKKLKQSAFYDLFMDKEKMPGFEDELEDFISSTGFDIRENLHEVYVAGQISGKQEPKDFLAVARGDYDPQRMMDYVKKHSQAEKMEKEVIEDYEVYLVGDEQMAFCFADNQTLLAGNITQLKAWLKKKSGSSSKASVKPAISGALKQLKYKNGMWFTMNASSLFESIGDSDLKKLKGLKSVTNLSFSALLNDRFNFSSTGEFSDEQNAQLFEDAVKGIIATGKLSLSDERDVIDILNKIDVETKDNTIRVQFQMAREEIEKLMDKRDDLRRDII